MPPDRGAGRDPGFTLIEMLVVLTIIGLAIGLALPLIGRGTPRATLTAAAEEVRAALGAARLTAIAEDRPVVFRGDPAGFYWIDGHAHHFGGTGALRVATTGGAPIAFYASGGASGGVVVVRGPQASREIRIDAISGHATIVR